MKLSHLIEAHLAGKYKEGQQLTTTPKLQRKGDFVWHLFKFFEPGKTDTQGFKNPEYRKALMKIVMSVLEEFQQKYPRSKVWRNMNIRKIAGPIVSSIWVHEPFGDDDALEQIGEYDPEEMTREEYDQEMALAHQENQEYEREMQGWHVNPSHGLSSVYKRNKRTYQHAPSTEKIFKQVKAAIKTRLNNVQSQLPPESIPKRTTIAYWPKDEFKAYVGNSAIESINVILDPHGIVLKASIKVDGGMRGSGIPGIKKIQDMDPTKLRELLTYYTAHDWD